MNPSDNKDIEEQTANPYFAVIIAESLFAPRTLTLAKEDWVTNNTKLIEKLGERQWLIELLNMLSGRTTPPPAIDPTQAITISNKLAASTRPLPLVSQDVWIGANLKSIKELGTEPWLWRLLTVLEKGTPNKQ